MMSPSVNASINRDMGTLFGLTGEALANYQHICQASVEHQELAWFYYMPQMYIGLGISLEEACIKLEKLLLSETNYVSLMPTEQHFMDSTPFLRRAREMLLPAKAALTPFYNLGLPKPYTLRFAVQAHLSTITDILSVQSGIVTSSLDETLHKVRFDGTRPRILATTSSPILALCTMNNNLFASMSHDNELYANRITGPPVSAEGPLTDANDMITKYYSLQTLGDQMFACLMADRMVEIWRRGSLWGTLQTEHVTTMTVLPNRNLLAIAMYRDGSLSLDEWTPADIRLSEGERLPTRSTPVAPDAVNRIPRLVAALGNDHIALVCEETPTTLRVIALGSGTLIHTCVMVHPICSLAFYADREQLFAGNQAGLLLIWQMAELIQRPREPEWTAFSVSKAPITALKPLHDNALACGDHYGRLHVIDLH
jgi:hypothetical protein